jgi:hypothetical protein
VKESVVAKKGSGSMTKDANALMETKGSTSAISVIDGILKLFKKSEPLSSQELREALADAERGLDAAKASLDLLEQRRDVLLIEGSDEDVAACDREIVSGSLVRDRLTASVARIEERIAEAEVKEHEQEIERRSKEARMKSRELRDLYLVLAADLCSLATKIEAGKLLMADMRKHNEFLLRNSRADLKVNHPIGTLCIKLGRPVHSLPDPLLATVSQCLGHPDLSLLQGLRDLDL